MGKNFLGYKKNNYILVRQAFDFLSRLKHKNCSLHATVNYFTDNCIYIIYIIINNIIYYTIWVMGII